MLPHLFKLRGQPMSLKDHIQFHAMYSNEYAADTLFLCGRQVGKCAQVFTKADHFAQRDASGRRMDSPDSVREVISASPIRTAGRPVAEVQRPGPKPLVKITTRLGSELRVSREHRIMQYGGMYKEAGGVRPGDLLAHAARCYRFGTDTAQPAEIERAAALLAASGQECGAAVPDWVFTLDEPCTAAFLRALWAAGGTIAYDRHGAPAIAYATRSALLAGDMAALLSKYGIPVRRQADSQMPSSAARGVTLYVEGAQSCVAFAALFTGPGMDGQLPRLYGDSDIVPDEVVSVEDHGTHDTFDLTVAGEEHNYVMDGIVVHNSLNLSRIEVLDALSSPELQLLYVAPLQSQSQRYSTLYLNEAIKSCELARINQMKALEGMWSDAKILTAVGHQTFANGSGIQLTYAKTSPDRARGIYADVIDFDEVQDQVTDNIPIISQSTKSSKWGIRRFTGTAKTADNTIEGLWQNSSQCEWAMHCPHCNAWNIPNLDGRVLDMIQADGLHCVECGGRLDVRQGEWVPARPKLMTSFRGYHIPQIVLPFHAENPDNWGKIMRDVLTLPVPVILQEVLGISCSQGQRLIDQSVIDRQSVLPSMLEMQDQLHRYAFTVGGIDWGGAEQVSFTVHVVLGVCADGSMDVLWARRYHGFDPDEMLTEMAKTAHFYHCRATAADYGLGFDKNVMLESRFGLPICQIQLCRQNSLMAYRPALGHQRWMVDKTTALDLMFMAIRYGKIRFPPKEEFDIYTKDLLSPYEQVVDHGELAHRRYMRDPSRPDDFAMALCFASMTAMRLQNSSIVDMVPDDALRAEPGKPAYAPLDPSELLKALST